MPVDRAERRRRMRRRETIRWARSLAIALAAALILRFFVLDFVRIAGVSMNDTLMTGDIALATKFRLLVFHAAAGRHCAHPHTGARRRFRQARDRPTGRAGGYPGGCDIHKRRIL